MLSDKFKGRFSTVMLNDWWSGGQFETVLKQFHLEIDKKNCIE